MTQSERILQLAEENHGTVTSAAIDELGIPRMIINFLVKQGKLVRLSRGVYGLPGTLDDAFFNEQTRLSKGVFSLMSALYLLGYSDSLPKSLQVSLPQSYNASKAKERGVYCLNQPDSLYEVGVLELYTPRGNKVRCYCIERTLCECLRRPAEVDMGCVRKAMAKYLHGAEANVHVLQTYAKMFNVEEAVKICIDLFM